MDIYGKCTEHETDYPLKNLIRGIVRFCESNLVQYGGGTYDTSSGGKMRTWVVRKTIRRKSNFSQFWRKKISKGGITIASSKDNPWSFIIKTSYFNIYISRGIATRLRLRRDDTPQKVQDAFSRYCTMVPCKMDEEFIISLKKLS